MDACSALAHCGAQQDCIGGRRFLLQTLGADAASVWNEFRLPVAEAAEISEAHKGLASSSVVADGGVAEGEDIAGAGEGVAAADDEPAAGESAAVDGESAAATDGAGASVWPTIAQTGRDAGVSSRSRNES